MAASPESFQQVKDILRKLDQSIDAARDRRLHRSPDARLSSSTAIGVTNSPAARPPLGPNDPIPQARPLNRARPRIRPDDSR